MRNKPVVISLISAALCVWTFRGYFGGKRKQSGKKFDYLWWVDGFRKSACLEAWPCKSARQTQISSHNLGGVYNIYVLEACIALCASKKDVLCCFKFTILIKLTLSAVEYLCTLSNTIYFIQLGTSSVTQYPDFPRQGGSAGSLVQNFSLILSIFLLTLTSFSWGRSFTPYLWLIHAKPSWTSVRAFPGKKERNNPYLSSLVHMPLLILHLNLASWTWTITVDSNWPQMLFLTITALQINCPQLEKERQASLSNLSLCNHFAIANNILLE